MRPESLIKHTVKSGDCLEWTSCRDDGGYGRWRGSLAHRLSYEMAKGEIPEGLELDHLCLNTWCVNPDHLEPVTREENARRRSANQTHCKRGHPFSPENTYMTPSGSRQCRACNAASVKRYKDRKAASVAAGEKK